MSDAAYPDCSRRSRESESALASNGPSAPGSDLRHERAAPCTPRQPTRLAQLRDLNPRYDPARLTRAEKQTDSRRYVLRKNETDS